MASRLGIQHAEFPFAGIAGLATDVTHRIGRDHTTAIGLIAENDAAVVTASQPKRLHNIDAREEADRRRVISANSVRDVGG